MSSTQRTRIPMIVALAGGLTASASAAFNTNVLFEEAADPSTWGFANLIASLDAASTGFDYNPVSGFAWEFFGTEQDRTDVNSEVYEITSETVFQTGGEQIVMEPGSLVFAYRLRLVESNSLTVNGLREAQVLGAPLFGFGQDALQGSFLRGQGYITGGGLTNAPLSGDFDDFGDFGAFVDFQWFDPQVGDQPLTNDEEVVMLLFSDPADIGRGVLSLAAPPGQTGGLTGITQDISQNPPIDESPPVLIPIIPAPSVAWVGIGAGLLAAGRRRR